MNFTIAILQIFFSVYLVAGDVVVWMNAVGDARSYCYCYAVRDGVIYCYAVAVKKKHQL